MPAITIAFANINPTTYSFTNKKNNLYSYNSIVQHIWKSFSPSKAVLARWTRQNNWMLRMAYNKKNFFYQVQLPDALNFNIKWNAVLSEPPATVRKLRTQRHVLFFIGTAIKNQNEIKQILDLNLIHNSGSKLRMNRNLPSITINTTEDLKVRSKYSFRI